jgi:hypothetical protein
MLIRHLADCLTIIRHLVNRRTFVCRIADRRALVRCAYPSCRNHTNICSHKSFSVAAAPAFAKKSLVGLDV